MESNEICSSFQSDCKCRMSLLFVQMLFLVAVFLGACARASEFPDAEKEIFVFQASFLVGLLLAILEGIWCIRCPFFLQKLIHFHAVGFVSLLRTSQICHTAFA